jgi:hypothetical protein
MRLKGQLAPSIALAAAVAVIAIGLRLILRLPRLPYNVAELFLDDGSALALAIFAFALLWVGAGAMLLAHWLARSRRPYLVLPVGLVIVSMASRTLLKYSVTYESLDDVLGTNNLFFQVTMANMWGEFWRHAFLVTNAPDAVAYLERRIRYIALYSPLIVCLALAMLPVARKSRRRAATSGPQIWWLAASAVACLWLSKIIIIDWAATDNLTELIAPSGPFNLGGGLVLYLLVALIAANVALLIRAAERQRGGRPPLRLRLSRSPSAGFCWERAWTNISRSMDLSSPERSFCSVQIVTTPSAARRCSADGPSCKAEA